MKALKSNQYEFFLTFYNLNLHLYTTTRLNGAVSYATHSVGISVVRGSNAFEVKGLATMLHPEALMLMILLLRLFI